MTAIEFGYRKLRLAQDLNKKTIETIGLLLANKNEDGIYELPAKSVIVDYLNKLASEKKIKHFLLRGEHQEVYLFDNDDVISSVKVSEEEARKISHVIPIQLQDEKVTPKDTIPYEISRIENLFKLPKTLFNSGTCIYFLCRDERVVYVGQSENVHQRLVEHIRTKVFDSVFYLRVSAHKMSKIESALISYLKPEYNQTSLKQTNKSISLAESILKKTS